jgi:hypothetical protein
MRLFIRKVFLKNVYNDQRLLKGAFDRYGLVELSRK